MRPPACLQVADISRTSRTRAKRTSSRSAFARLDFSAYAHRYAEATLGSGNLAAAVKLPEGEDLNEWLAVNSAREGVRAPLIDQRLTSSTCASASTGAADRMVDH